jgi:hypothetical protein
MSNGAKVTGIGAAVGSLGLGTIITTWGAMRRFTSVGGTAGALVSVLLAAFAWLGWRALSRHRALAEVAEGSYAARHSGLIWGIGLASALTYTMARQQFATASGLEEQVWLLVVLGVVCVPVALWGGLMFRRTLERGLGIKPPDA